MLGANAKTISYSPRRSNFSSSRQTQASKLQILIDTVTIRNRRNSNKTNHGGHF